MYNFALWKVLNSSQNHSKDVEYYSNFARNGFLIHKKCIFGIEAQLFNYQWLFIHKVVSSIGTYVSLNSDSIAY